ILEVGAGGQTDRVGVREAAVVVRSANLISERGIGKVRLNATRTDREVRKIARQPPAGVATDMVHPRVSNQILEREPLLDDASPRMDQFHLVPNRNPDRWKLYQDLPRAAAPQYVWRVNKCGRGH